MRVICYGDSNTYGYDPRSYLGDRYPADCRWVDLLANMTGWEVKNAGENGREIPRRESELQRVLRMLSADNADLLIVMLGGNDLLQGADSAIAAERMQPADGNGSFRTYLLDALYNLDAETLAARAKVVAVR